MKRAIMKKALVLLLVLLVTTSSFTELVLANGSSSSSNDMVSVTKTVNPGGILEGGEAEVTLNVNGTPPINVSTPNDIILVIDRSGSMNQNGENKLANAKSASQAFVNMIDMDQHRVGVVDYSSTAGSFNLSSNGTEVNTYINTLTSGGGTATGDAILKSRELLENHRPNAQPVIVLLTDGEATHVNGSQSSNAMSYSLEQANAAKAEGIIFYTIALLNTGANPSTSIPNQLMMDMATTSQHHHFVLGSDGLNAVYEAISREIGVASAYDVTVTDYIAPEFEIVPGSYDSNIPRPVVNGNQISWHFNELKDQVLTFTYKIRHIPGSTVGNLPVGGQDINVTYEDYQKQQHTVNFEQPSIEVSYPAPVIDRLVQDNGLIEGGERVIVYGDNFRPNAKVTFGDKLASDIQYINKTQLELIVPPGQQGDTIVRLTNDDGQYAEASYRYYASPIINAITPNAGPVAGGNEVVITGQFFMNGATVKFGSSTAVVQSVTTSEIKATVPSALNAGFVDVHVINPDATSAVMTNGYEYAEAPVLTSVNPNKGLTTGGEIVTLSGSGFKPGAVVSFNSKQLQTEFVSSNELKISTPAWAKAESVDVVVKNTDGQSVVLTQGYTYELPAPTIKTVSPNITKTDERILVTITGENFVSGAKVIFDSVEVAATFIDSTTLRARSPIWTKAEVIDIKVTNPDNKQAILPDSFTYVLPDIFSLSEVTPNSGFVIGGNAVAVKGTNIPANAQLFFNDQQISRLTITSNQISFVAPEWPSAEKVNVKVVDGYGRIVEIPQGYEYLLPPPPAGPEIDSVSPNVVKTTGGEFVVVNGQNFVEGATVSLNDTQIAAVTFVSSQQLRFKAPVWGQAETVNVKVVNPDGQVALKEKALTYELPNLFSITSITPTSGLMTGGTSVTILGADIPANIQVYFGDTQAKISSATATKITLTTPVSTIEGKVDVKFVDSYGREVVLNQAYEYLAPPKPPAPTVTSVNPTSVAPTGGTFVYVNGDNYQQGAVVWLNDYKVSATFVSAKQLRFKSPVWSKGEFVDVKVVNPDNQEGVLAGGLEFQAPAMDPAPVISELTPNQGEITGDYFVVIKGEKFKSGAKVYFGSTLLNTTFLSASELRVKAPVWSQAEVIDVKVVNPDSQEVTLVGGFSYTLPAPPPAPIVTGVNPSSVVFNESTFVIIDGENFTSTSTVKLNDKVVTPTFLSDKQLRIKTPVWSGAEVVSVTVLNEDGQTGTLTDGLSFILPPPPSISNITPNETILNESILILLDGENFNSSTQVFFNDVQLAVTYLSSTQLRVRTGTWAQAESVTVKVVNTSGQFTEVANGFTFKPIPPKAAPMITEVTPNTGSKSVRNFVYINGSGFQSGATVIIGGTTIAATFMSEGQLRIRTPYTTITGSVDITVINPDGQQVTLQNAYTFY